MWVYYYTYVQRTKTDRIETPLGFAAFGSMCDKVKKKIKVKEMMANPVPPKLKGKALVNSFKSLFKRKK